MFKMRKKTWVFLACALFLVIVCAAAIGLYLYFKMTSTLIEVKQGQLTGIPKKSILTDHEFICYLGIPYAKPPVGNLRFQPPEPSEKWDGVLKAEKEGSVCFQINSDSGEYIGSEDCLYLNVYTPESPTKSTNPKAVMVYIHGGGFVGGSGSSDIFSADYLMNYDVILVTLNYRLHVLGFLDMGTKNCAGNCGLRDQWMAMKWVKENIKQFGGDPEKITIFGESAGASSVYLHLLSPMSKGLFNKAIIQSDLCLTFYERPRNLKKLGFELGQKLGYTEKDPEKLVEYLQKKPVNELCEHACKAQAPKDTFGPYPEIIKENGFLPDTYENLKKQAVPVPLIAGFNNQDGRVAFFVPNIMEAIKKDFTSILIGEDRFDVNQRKDICDKVKTYYLGDKPVSDESIEKIGEMFTDYFTRPFYDYIDFAINSKVPVYIYEFSFFGKFNVFDKQIVKKAALSLKSGASHGDEIPYLFYPKSLIPEIEFKEPEVTMIKNMCSLWTNFAKSTNPTATLPGIEWRPYKPEKPCFFSLNKDLKLVEEKLRGKEYDFWKKLIN